LTREDYEELTVVDKRHVENSQEGAIHKVDCSGSGQEHRSWGTGVVAGVCLYRHR
jgi:hypothetical protein